MKDSLNRFTVRSVSPTSNANVLLLFDSHIWERDKEGEPRNKRSQYKVRCFIVLIVLKLKQTNDSPFRLLSSFPVKSWSLCIIARTLYIGNWTWNLSDVNLLIEQLVKFLKRNRICGRELHPLTIPYITHQFLPFLG